MLNHRCDLYQNPYQSWCGGDFGDEDHPEASIVVCAVHKLEAERDALRKALGDAEEGLREMFGYVPEYFREKWNHQGYIDRARAAIDSTIGGKK